MAMGIQTAHRDVRRTIKHPGHVGLRTRLVLDPLHLAVTTRKPADVVHHSE